MAQLWAYDTSFGNNTASVIGGAVHVEDNSEADFYNCDFINVRRRGGGMCRHS